MINVIAIFDIGKTNKKLFLFDEQYKIVWEQSDICAQTVDEDGEPCEDILQLTEWAHQSLARITALADVRIKAINFSAYGASFVYIDRDGKPIAPLYNYLKAYPALLKNNFYDTYGGETAFSLLTASPVLESLNSGMQLYRVKEQQPGLFSNMRFALHLPQYFSFLLTGQACSDITSIGCHTNLWNFPQNHYHEWVYREGVADKLAPILQSTTVLPVLGGAGGSGLHGLTRAGEPDRLVGTPSIPLSGIGLHDSSAALIPYQESFREPFVLISTGTWCISMNPFNDAPLTEAELQKDCLCYMSYQGRPIKASRLFAGYEHEQQVQRLAAHFHTAPARAATVSFDAECVALLQARDPASRTEGPGAFHRRELTAFPSFEVAYHRLMMDIMDQQVDSTRLVLQDTDAHRIFVDGGFGRNQVYMHLLARAFPDTEVFTASIPQATAMGAALAIHQHWNSAPLPGDIIELKYYG
jgi:sugar (pentulose or hexulose) kinase